MSRATPRLDRRRKPLRVPPGFRSAQPRRLAPLGLLALAGLVPGPALVAQGTDEEPDRAAVLAVVDRLFDGMRANDGDVVRSVFIEGATLVSTENAEGEPMTRLIPTEGFAQAVDNATIPWDEPTWDPIVQVRDHLATVWVKYAFYAGEEFSHCGVDAFILARQRDGAWKIAALADTRQREDCELPPDRGPGR